MAITKGTKRLVVEFGAPGSLSYVSWSAAEKGLRDKHGGM